MNVWTKKSISAVSKIALSLITWMLMHVASAVEERGRKRSRERLCSGEEHEKSGDLHHGRCSVSQLDGHISYLWAAVSLSAQWKLAGVFIRVSCDKAFHCYNLWWSLLRLLRTVLFLWMLSWVSLFSAVVAFYPHFKIPTFHSQGGENWRVTTYNKITFPGL